MDVFGTHAAVSPERMHEVVLDGRPQKLSVALREAWATRQLLKFMLLRDVRGRYRGTFLGNWWIIARPLIELSPYLIVFGIFLNLRPGPVPYVLYLLSGFAPWLFIRACITGAPSLLSKSRSLLKKVYFPRFIIPLNALILAFLDFLVVSVCVVIATFGFGFGSGLPALALPLFMLLAAVLGLGLMLFLSAICVWRPDVSFSITAGVRLLFYSSPIVYPLSVVPLELRPLYDLNPVTAIVSGFRWALFGLDAPSLQSLCAGIVMSLIILCAGLAAFLRVERNLADTL